jgi:translation initiation factor eIF-2B subunit epsilon
MKDGKLVSSLKSRLEFWGPLLQKMSIGIEEEKSILYGLEQVAIQENSPVATKLSTGLSFRFVLQTLHDEEVLSEEAILSWAAERKEEPVDSALGKLFQMKSIQEFLEWLEEEDDEDSGDDSDESGSASGLTDDDAEHSA